MDFSKSSTRFSVQEVKWRYPMTSLMSSQKLGLWLLQNFFLKKN